MVLRDLQLDDLSDLANSDNWDLKTSLTRVVTARVKCCDLGGLSMITMLAPPGFNIGCQAKMDRLS